VSWFDDFIAALFIVSRIAHIQQSVAVQLVVGVSTLHHLPSQVVVVVVIVVDVDVVIVNDMTQSSSSQPDAGWVRSRQILPRLPGHRNT